MNPNTIHLWIKIDSRNAYGEGSTLAILCLKWFPRSEEMVCEMYMSFNC